MKIWSAVTRVTAFQHALNSLASFEWKEPSVLKSDSSGRRSPNETSKERDEVRGSDVRRALRSRLSFGRPGLAVRPGRFVFQWGTFSTCPALNVERSWHVGNVPHANRSVVQCGGE